MYEMGQVTCNDMQKISKFQLKYNVVIEKQQAKRRRFRQFLISVPAK